MPEKHGLREGGFNSSLTYRHKIMLFSYLILQLGNRIKTVETQNAPFQAQSAPPGRKFGGLPRVGNDPT